MTPYISDPDFTLHVGDVTDVLATLPDESVHCVITSPPYWGLRDYGTGSWNGGNPDCDHKGAPAISDKSTLAGYTSEGIKLRTNTGSPFRDVCGKCGASRVDQQIGLEPTPEAYVARMVEVFRQVRRVLRTDGTLWLNIGDSYNADHKQRERPNMGLNTGKARTHENRLAPGLKPKDLVGIPWSLAKALQAPYYTGRIPAERDRVWLAATLDAEGTICGFSHDRKDDGRTRTGLMFNITNASEALLAEATRIWPANLHRHMRSGAGHLGNRDVYRWHVNGIENKTALIRELYPHLIVKRTQALLAYNLLALMSDAKRLARTPQARTVTEKRSLLVRLLSDLNQGRAVDVPSWCVEPTSLFEPGWYVRSDIVWSKANPMPESVTDRPTKAHEYLFLLTKSARYFYDGESIREPEKPWNGGRMSAPSKHESNVIGGAQGYVQNKKTYDVVKGANRRSVWEVATEPYPDAHFATYPQALIEPCIKAGTSERGCCPMCGAPWTRETERTPMVVRESVKGADKQAQGLRTSTSGTVEQMPTSRTLGWLPTCECIPAGAKNCIPERPGDTHYVPVPCVVLDPFLGSGTTALVARKHSRHSIGIELNPTYAELAAKRLNQLSLLAEGAA